MLYWKKNYEKCLVNAIAYATLVNGPANLQSPPKPQDCKKWSGCCEESSDANIFWMMLWTAAKTTWSLDDERTLLIFWSSNEWLKWRSCRNIILVEWIECNSKLTSLEKLSGKLLNPQQGIDRGREFLLHHYKNKYENFIILIADINYSNNLEYLTRVASTVRTSACVELSGRTSGSKRTFDSFETEERDPRS